MAIKIWLESFALPGLGMGAVQCLVLHQWAGSIAITLVAILISVMLSSPDRKD